MSQELNCILDKELTAVISGNVSGPNSKCSAEDSTYANVKRKRGNSDVAKTSRKMFSNVRLSADHCNVNQDISASIRSSSLSNPSQHSDSSLAAIRIQTGKSEAGDHSVPSKERKTTNTNEPTITSEQECLVQSKKRSHSASDDGGAPEKKRACTKSRKSSSSVENVDVSYNDHEDICHVFKNMSPEEENIYEMSSSANTSKTDFERKYIEAARIGMGGFASVYCGYRKDDLLQVAIKHIARKYIRFEQLVCNGKVYIVILEVALMLKSTGLTESVGQSAAVSLLDWYLLEDELILIMEKPALCRDLLECLRANGGPLEERQAKIILRQLVDAAIDMQDKGVFHRDIKLENVLIQFDAGEPRVRVIDFGCGHFSTEETFFSMCGTFQYLPPEWFDYRAYWARPTTVWQLGALFYSLLNGQFRTIDFISNRIQINCSWSTDCKILLEMCLARDPAERATLEDLQHFLALRETSPQTISPSPNHQLLRNCIS